MAEKRIQDYYTYSDDFLGNNRHTLRCKRTVKKIKLPLFMKQYLLKMLSLAVFLVITGWVVFTFVLPQYYLPVFPFVLLFFVLFSVAIHTWQTHLSKSTMGKFTRSNMILTFLKLLFYSAFVIIYIATDRENAKIFTIVFMIHYLVFTTFEVILLTSSTSSKK